MSISDCLNQRWQGEGSCNSSWHGRFSPKIFAKFTFVFFTNRFPGGSHGSGGGGHGAVAGAALGAVGAALGHHGSGGSSEKKKKDKRSGSKEKKKKDKKRSGSKEKKKKKKKSKGSGSSGSSSSSSGSDSDWPHVESLPQMHFSYTRMVSCCNDSISVKSEFWLYLSNFACMAFLDQAQSLARENIKVVFSLNLN